MEWQGRVAVVTGANSGIGFGITQRLLEMGLTVVGIDIDLSNIEGENANLHPYKADLTDENQITRAFQWIDEKFKRVDVLVNSAGLMSKSSLLDGDMDEWRRMFAVNVFAVSQCTVEAVNIIKKREVDFGNIINITSRAAQIVSTQGPHHIYCATKFAVRALTEGFRYEFTSNKLPIRMSCIEPGLVRSKIFLSSGGEEEHEKMYNKGFTIEPSDIAAVVQNLLNLPENVNVINSIVQHRQAAY